MKKFLLIAAVVMAATPAFAEWTLIGQGETSGKWFIDKSTIRSVGGMRRAWILNDLPKRDKDGDLSSRAFYEVDCAEERFRNLQNSFYKGPMGSGQPSTSSYQPFPWKYAAPGTMGTSILDAVCNP